RPLGTLDPCDRLVRGREDPSSRACRHRSWRPEYTSAFGATARPRHAVESSRRAPIVVLDVTEHRERDDATGIAWRLAELIVRIRNRPDRLRGSRSVVKRHVVLHDAEHVPFIEENEVVERFTPEAEIESLHECVRVRCAVRD